VPLVGRTGEDHRHLFTEEIVKLMSYLKQMQEDAKKTSSGLTPGMYDVIESYLYKLDHKLYIYAVLYYCELYSIGEEKELKFRLPPKAVRMARGHLKRTARCVLSVAFHDVARFIDSKYLSITTNISIPKQVVNSKTLKLSASDKIKRIILSKAKTKVAYSDVSSGHSRLVKSLRGEVGSKHPVEKAFEELHYFGSHDTKTRKFTKFSRSQLDAKRVNDINEYAKQKEVLAKLGLAFETLGFGKDELEDNKSDSKLQSSNLASGDSGAKNVHPAVSNADIGRSAAEAPVNYMTPSRPVYQKENVDKSEKFNVPTNGDQFLSPLNFLKGMGKVGFNPMFDSSMVGYNSTFDYSMSPKSPVFLKCSDQNRMVQFANSNLSKDKISVTSISTKKRNVGCVDDAPISCSRKKPFQQLQTMKKTNS